MKANQLVLVCAVALAAASCFSVPGPQNIVDRAINKTVDSAANRVGEDIGRAVAANILAKNPHLIQAYAMGVFNAMFYQGGYYFDSGEYDEGEFTVYRTSGLEQGDTFEKTLLTQHSTGNQWWRVETRSEPQGDEEPAVVVMEALFGPPSSATGGRKVLRMRALLPGEEAAREIPITERNSQTWQLNSANRLTAESKEGMTVGTAEVETPAGKFTTQHLQSAAHDQAKLNWYLADEVPGELVKFERTDPEGQDGPDYQVVLEAFGDGRTESKLGIDLGEKAAATPAPEEAPAEDQPAE